MFGVTNGERSHSIAFTERGAKPLHYGHRKFIGLQCGIRTHIIPRPKRGAITRLGEPERISFLHSLMTLKELIDCDGWTQTSDLYIYLVTPRTVNCSATHSATLMFVFGPGWCPSDAKSIT